MAAGLLGVVATAMVSLINNANKSQKSVQNAVDFDLLKTSLNLVLNSKSCDNAFQVSSGAPVTVTFPATLSPGTNIIPATSPVLIDKIVLGNTTLAERDKNLGGGLILHQLNFSEAVYDGEQTLVDNSVTPPVSTTYKAFTSVLQVGARSTSMNYGASSFQKSLVVRLLVRPTGALSGRIEKCSASPQSEPGMPKPDFDSDWLDFSTGGENKTVTHNLGTENYFVLLEGQARATGGDGSNCPTFVGPNSKNNWFMPSSYVFYYNRTANTVSVKNSYASFYACAPKVRVLIWKW